MSFPFLAALSDRAVHHEYASTKSMNIGQKGMTEDGSVYRLCKAGAAMTGNIMEYKVTYHNFQGGLTGTAIEPALAVAIVAGDITCTFTDATNARAADYYKGGYVCQPRETGDNTMRIWKSDAEVSNTYKLHVTTAFTLADAVGNTIMVYPNRYADVRDADEGPRGQANDSIVCFINHTVTSGYHFWGLVRGPHWAHIGNGGWPGATDEDRAVCSYPGGTLRMANDSWSTTSNQYLGFMMMADSYGDAFIMVQIE